jgi:hypothetical protein
MFLLKNALKSAFFALSVVFCFIRPGAAFSASLGNVQLTPYASIKEIHDDNITFTKDNTRDDFITQTSLGLKAAYDGKTQSADMSGTIDWNAFAQNRSFNNLSQEFSVNAAKELSPYDRLALSEAFRHAEEPRSFDDQLGRTAGRYSYCQNQASLVYTREITKQLSTSFNYSHSLVTYSRSDLTNSYLNKMGVDSQYAFSSASIAIVSYAFSRRTFGSGSPALTHTVTAGGRRYLTGKLYLEGASGVNFLKAYTGRRYTKPFFNCSLNNTIDAITFANISFIRQYSPNANLGDIFNSWQVSAGFSRQLLRKLAGNCSLFYGKGAYISADIKDTFTGVNTGLAYDLREKIQLLLEYGYAQTTSNYANREYARNSISAGLKMSF